MKISVAVFTVLILTLSTAHSQQPKSFAVMTWATVTATPEPKITLHWAASSFGKSVSIWKKLKSVASFPTNAIATLDSAAASASSNSWVDNDVETGVSYEYRLIRDMWEPAGKDSVTGAQLYAHYWAFGYINSGILAPPSERRRVLALVDTTMMAPLSQDLQTWKTDVENEGWSVTILATERSETFDSGAVARTRQLIKDEIRPTKRDVDAIFLIGRVPVPYAGDIRPDGHPDHTGAWPADGTYGDDNGTYTDRIVNRPNNSRKSNENLLADGKYDQSLFASPLETPVGRVDFYNMPEFSKSEIALLKDYFKKDHDFRTAQFPVLVNGIVDDNFGTYGEGFATSAWRGYSVFGTDTCVKAGDWFGSLAGPSTFLFGYGCGGGTDISANGVGTTTDMAANPVYAVHTQLFGSYFGDWDTQNNFLRSSLATSPRALTCGWVGRPAWYIHHMALGETIGYSARISQNNSPVVGNALGTYTPNIIYDGTQGFLASAGDRGVHIALLGDPTLRAIMKPVAAVGQVTARVELPNMVNLSWLKPTGDAAAYVVYRRTRPTDLFVLLTPKPITTTSFKDSLLHDGTVEYKVHACAIRETASGTYYDMGKAAYASAVTVGVDEFRMENGEWRIAASVTPNPVNEGASIRLSLRNGGNIDVSVIDVAGVQVWSAHFEALAAGEQLVYCDATSLASGRYTIVVRSAQSVATTSMIVLH